MTDDAKQEPEAMRYGFDGFGYRYIDSGSGSDWRTRHSDAEPLYAQPQTDAPKPKPKPDPLVEVIAECDDGTYGETKAEYAAKFRAALEARGLEIREKNDEG